MGILVSLPVIPYFLNKLIKLNNEINGQWFRYLYIFSRLWVRRQRNTTNRIMKHKIWPDDMRSSGILPFDHEWQLDSPSQTKCEDLLIYGVNSSKQSLKISLKSILNKGDNLKNRKALISLRFDDNDGNYYTLNEESNVENKKKEYKISGLTIETISPFKKRRIKFRGYLKKNGDKLVYIKFRFLWYTLSRVYDFTHDFDDQFLSKELSKCKFRKNELDLLEDRLGQFGQIKGTFTEEGTTERIIYLWGAADKKFLETKPINRRIIRVVGYCKTGIGFQLGFICNNDDDNNGLEYRFGLIFELRGAFKKLRSTTLQKSDFEDLLRNSPNISFKALFGEKEYEFEIKENKKCLANHLFIDGNEGMCYIFEENETEFQDPIEIIENKLKDSSLVFGLNEENAKTVELTGGKGSSLAVLMSLSQQLIEEKYENKFNVANGVVVTTNAYQIIIEEYDDIKKTIQDLEETTDIPKDELKIKCQNLVNLISNKNLPQIIANEIEVKLKQNFNNKFKTKFFAVRSSGASEDSEEMSAAGQMTTYLGVKGIEEINQSVMKCWSSQFSYIAFEYRRGYGQPINSPMAVVIQEMIDCESAGVMFTCDPISGDERIIEITGNHGLGESVVSASSEPDTIRMSVNIESNSLSKRRTIEGIASKVIGAKKTSIKLLENGGTVEVEVFDKESCCISDEDLNRLGNLGLRIHKHYGNARDIEWGLKEGQAFIFQSRPITNLDNSYTDYEMIHEMDSPHQTEYEIYSRAHWGENFPGSSSWTVLGWFWTNRQEFFREMLADGLITEDDYDPYLEPIGVQYNQVMFNLGNGSLYSFNEYPTTNRSNQLVLSFFGHHIEDQDVLNLFEQKRKTMKKLTLFAEIKAIFTLIYYLIFGPKNLIKDKKYFMEEINYDLAKMLKKYSCSKQMWDLIKQEYFNVIGNAIKNHGPISIGCCVRNGILKDTLKNALENNPNLEDDYNLIISSGEDVISAEVPNYLREIAKYIKDKKQFIKLSDEDALNKLRSGTDSASQKFNEFIERHGHRGYREMDPMHPPWRDDPIPCIKTIKGLLSGCVTQLEPKAVKTVDEVINELKTPLTFIREMIVKKILLPWSRAGVGYRELSKYFMMWLCDKQRQGFNILAKKMVEEGLIPTVDVFYYLTILEVDSLCKGDRDPLINKRARLRKRIYPKMNKYMFDEFIKGPEMKPRNFDDQSIPKSLDNVSVCMSGTPISSGTIEARVCVVEDITGADNIQSGDILITYSTDIGWSPYFTLLSGIVTEIGGTVSHGAVIAREYGIPSLIAVEGVCRAFETGDICVLDTKTATITKLAKE